MGYIPEVVVDRPAPADGPDLFRLEEEPLDPEEIRRDVERNIFARIGEAPAVTRDPLEADLDLLDQIERQGRTGSGSRREEK